MFDPLSWEIILEPDTQKARLQLSDGNRECKPSKINFTRYLFFVFSWFNPVEIT